MTTTTTKTIEALTDGDQFAFPNLDPDTFYTVKQTKEVPVGLRNGTVIRITIEEGAITYKDGTVMHTVWHFNDKNRQSEVIVKKGTKTMTTTVKPSQVTVSTREYERSHFRKPRGRGGWMFAPEGWTYGDWDAVIDANGTYTEARKQATEQAARLGIRYISVLP